jgi:probable selenate reductase FAD-binding subunit
MIEGFHRPETVEEALALAGEYGERALFLAGGTEVNSTAGRRNPAHLISLAGLGLELIERASDAVMIGSCATLQDLLDSDLVPAPLQAAAATVFNRNVRNVATVGGHLAADRAFGDLLPTLIALEARVRVHPPEGPVDLPVEGYLAEKGALVTAIRVGLPTRPTGVRCFARSPSDKSILAAAASLDVVDGAVSRPIVAIGGVAPRMIRLPAVESWLDGAPLPDDDAIEVRVAELVEPVGDYIAGAAAKKHLAGVLVARALRDAWEGGAR